MNLSMKSHATTKLSRPRERSIKKWINLFEKNPYQIDKPIKLSTTKFLQPFYNFSISTIFLGEFHRGQNHKGAQKYIKPAFLCIGLSLFSTVKWINTSLGLSPIKTKMAAGDEICSIEIERS